MILLIGMSQNYLKISCQSLNIDQVHLYQKHTLNCLITNPKQMKKSVNWACFDDSYCHISSFFSWFFMAGRPGFRRCPRTKSALPVTALLWSSLWWFSIAMDFILDILEWVIWQKAMSAYEANFFYVLFNVSWTSKSKFSFGEKKSKITPSHSSVAVRMSTCWIFHDSTGMPTSAVPSTRAPLRKKRRCRNARSAAFDATGSHQRWYFFGGWKHQ